MWRQFERLARMVCELYAAQPTFTAIAGIGHLKAEGMNSHAPNLDNAGINTYKPAARRQR
jgi:hypothetical protein